MARWKSLTTKKYIANFSGLLKRTWKVLQVVKGRQINKKMNFSEFIGVSISGRSQKLHSIIITSHQLFNLKCGSIMAWGSFASSRPRYLVIIEKTINSYSYQKILLENFSNSNKHLDLYTAS